MKRTSNKVAGMQNKKAALRLTNWYAENIKGGFDNLNYKYCTKILHGEIYFGAGLLIVCK